MGYMGSVMAAVLLLIGYPLALAVLTRLRSVLTERRVWWFAALEAATVTVAAGWLLHGRLLPAAVNGAAFVGFVIAWLVTGQRAGPPLREHSLTGVRSAGDVGDNAPAPLSRHRQRVTRPGRRAGRPWRAGRARH